MKIAIATSMMFAERAMEVKKELEKSDNEVFISEFVGALLGKTDKEKEKLIIFQKNEKDAIRRFWEQIRKSDALLVLNYDRRGVKNYIGGNTLMEIGFAFVLNKKIFLLNPIPEIEYYKSEIVAMKPTIINGDFSKIR